MFFLIKRFPGFFRWGFDGEFFFLLFLFLFLAAFLSQTTNSSPR